MKPGDVFGKGGGYFFEVFSEVVEALKTTIGYLKLRLTGRMLSDAGSMFIDSNDGELMALADLGLGVPSRALLMGGLCVIFV